ncbi:peroxisomal biogenesis factor 3-like [Oppia nitens]|uniref:peroxisomal biogenesis factor 3-like n=1 Tax=Oppia nitens TaxID=1686743 RepID=UPI0023DAEB53|nr:peroxisomal biogenesis factor 3-like [Oppia nitens]
MSSLLKTTWDFFKRHRNKALLGTATAAGVYALNRYLHSVADEWQQSSSRDFVSEVKKKEIHFENTIDTCNQTSMSLSVKIVDILDQTLDAEPILEQIKLAAAGAATSDHHNSSNSNGSNNKIELWNRLKIQIFTRVIAEVYCVTLFVTYLRVQLSVLAGYIYMDSSSGQLNTGSGSANATNLMQQMQTTSSNVQNKYLSLLHTFYSTGIQQIIEPIMAAVEDSLKDISLKDQIVMNDLKIVFDKVKSSMAFTLNGCQSNASRFLINPNKLFISSETNGLNNGLTGDKDGQLLQRMINETQDILESDDFKRVVDSGIDLGFAVLMDVILGCFVRFSDEKTGQTVSSSSLSSSDNGFANPHSIRMPLVKLLPKVWLSLRDRRRPEEKLVLVRHLICLDVLNCFAANIYEAFCQTN